ncbi:MAG TPA: GAF domain-containing protein [Candidatus Wallbacteria bacterium]|nr:GAF domain-containing protein [Candidatus Wallbacteria bacterium]
MPALNIKKIVNRKKIVSVINDILRLANASIAIKDNEGNIIFGERPDDPLCKHSPVHISGEIVCWIAGKKEAEYVFPLICYVITGEIERYRLADETLEKYKELNMFYNLSEKIATTIDFKELSSFILDEARNMIRCTDGCIFIVKKESNDITLVDFFGETGFQQTIIDFCRMNENKNIFFSKAEIVNDMKTDIRFQKVFNSTSAMIFSPLKFQQEPIGLICLATKENASYLAKDLKLIRALSLQATAVFNNARLH